MGNCGFSWIFQWRWWQWIDERRTLLGTDAFRDRYVALNFVTFHSFDAIWTSIVRPRLLEAQLCPTLPFMLCASMCIWRVRTIYPIRPKTMPLCLVGSN